MSLNIEKIKNVLVLMPDKHMGDLVLSLSAISALNEFFKEKTFYLVADSAYAEIIETISGLDNVLYYPRKLLKKKSFIKRLAIQFDFLRQLRNTSPDISIDLHGGTASSLMSFLSGASLRIGKSTAKRPYLYNMKVDLLQDRHKIYGYAEIASSAGAQSREGIHRIKASWASISELKNILIENGLTIEKPIVCIHPGAGVIYKKWTEQGFADISDWLTSKGFQVIFVGAGDDLEVITKIMNLLKHNAYNLGGKLSIGQLIALIETSSLYIGNDSGPMHLAEAVDIPVIALFGPADEGRWGPLSEESIVLRGEEPCEDCKRKDCQYEFKCIRLLSSKDLKIAIEKLIRHPD